MTADARLIAKRLVQTSLWGINSHGVAHLPHSQATPMKKHARHTCFALSALWLMVTTGAIHAAEDAGLGRNQKPVVFVASHL